MAMVIDILGESAKPQLGSLVAQGYVSKLFTDTWVAQNIDNVYSVQLDGDELIFTIEHVANLVFPLGINSVTFYGDTAKMIIRHWNDLLVATGKAM